MEVALLNRDDMGDRLNRADLRSGDDMVVLFQRPKHLDKDALAENGATHHTFIVDREDFELAVQRMKDWGVKIHNIPRVDRPTGSGFYFFDPDGNLLQLYAPPKSSSTPVKPQNETFAGLEHESRDLDRAGLFS